MTPFLIIFSISLFIGLVTGVILVIVRRKLLVVQAKKQAESLIKAVEEKVQSKFEEFEERIKQNSEQSLKHLDKEIQRKEEKLEQLEIKLKGKEEKLQWDLDKKQRKLNQRQNELNSYQGRLKQVEKKYLDRRESLQELSKKWFSELTTKVQVSPEELRPQIEETLAIESKRSVQKQIQFFEEEFSQGLEKQAKRALYVALNRFQRPYCAERGLGYLQYEQDHEMRKVLGPDNKFLQHLEKLCGVDLVVNPERKTISISGFDPVRRELAREVLEKLGRDNRLDIARIEQVYQNTKKELFRKITSDGERIARELKVQKLHDEVKNMMGALRYRYSFSQNQYFHCGEVGFLCGLLASELQLSIPDARRSGLLHDIGKAMDHSVDGGHAVIGADFINQHGEEARIVHAVRAHHYDETPKTDLAFLVIAADAISGARPGARRSTVDSYMQKMEELESIGNSFDGVLATYVLSAGREIRVMVDSNKVDDVKALQLSKQMAHKIENDMAYPGQIKVTVVRETQAIDYAR